MATIKVNPVTPEQKQIPMVNPPSMRNPNPKRNQTVNMAQLRRSVANTETSTRQGHPPPRTTGKEDAQPQRPNSND